MPTYGTTDEGKDNIIATAIYTSSLKIGLYTNSADTLGSDSVLADIVETSGTGYAQQSLNGTWAFTSGVVTYTPNIQFTNSDASAAWSPDVTGVFISDGTYLLHFLDRPAGAKTVAAGETIEIDISTLI